ncbi:MAG TPA: hypothetical protein VKD69_27170 [Vicinamibacterales bacterium]|nr:hypothetical protein [Vicinamibacterales bacterium]
MLSLRTVARARPLVIVGLAVYVAVLVSSPFEHHDLICHLKTPQHCTSCASSQLGSDPHALPAPAASRLSDAGMAATFELHVEEALFAATSSGRSPPPVL